jgi:metal-responsive CopG/Arc/MetJ family transcriptional regulator
MKRHNFFLPTELVEELKIVAATLGVPMSELIRQAITQFLKKHAAGGVQ